MKPNLIQKSSETLHLSLQLCQSIMHILIVENTLTKGLALWGVRDCLLYAPVHERYRPCSCIADKRGLFENTTKGKHWFLVCWLHYQSSSQRLKEEIFKTKRKLNTADKTFETTVPVQTHSGSAKLPTTDLLITVNWTTIPGFCWSNNKCDREFSISLR